MLKDTQLVTDGLSQTVHNTASFRKWLNIIPLYGCLIIPPTTWTDPISVLISLISHPTPNSSQFSVTITEATHSPLLQLWPMNEHCLSFKINLFAFRITAPVAYVSDILVALRYRCRKLMIALWRRQ